MVKSEPSTLARTLAGNLASLTSVTTCFPLEVVKTRMQVQGGLGVSKFGLSSLKSVVQEEGIRGLYRGYLVSAFTLPLQQSLYFPMYEKIKLELKKR